jgi:ribosomal protein S24E
MKFQVIEEKENPVLKRKEVLISLDYEKGSTPSKAELQKVLSEQLNANMENVEISKILSEIGRPVGKAWIKVWQEKKVPLYSELKKEKEEPKPEKAPEKVEEKPKEEQKKEKEENES